MSPEAYELTPPRYRYLAEDAAHISLNRYFRKAGVMFVAASGDAGTQLLFPASSPYVLAVGGTYLETEVSGAYAAWLTRAA